MTIDEQTAALQQFGYTAREAEFLALAALHSGYFLRRQFCPKRGKLADTLCRKVLARQHARATVYGRNTHLYHLFAKPLYIALGQDDNRHRRPHDPFYLRAKVMGFDYVLAHPGYRFLPTEQEKLHWFCEVRGTRQKDLPTKIYTGKDRTQTERYFVDKYPVRIDPQTGKVAFCYINDGVYTPPGFLTWLRQYTPLLEALGEAEVIYIAPSEAAFPAAQREFAMQFPAGGGAVAPELLAYFELRKDFEQHGPAGRPQGVLDLYRRLSRRYAEPRFEQQYTAWSERRKRSAECVPDRVFHLRVASLVRVFRDGGRRQRRIGGGREPSVSDLKHGDRRPGERRTGLCPAAEVAHTRFPTLAPAASGCAYPPIPGKSTPKTVTAKETARVTRRSWAAVTLAVTHSGCKEK